MPTVRYNKELAAEKLEKITGTQFVVLYLAVIFTFGLVYFLLGNGNNGIVPSYDPQFCSESKSANILECMYFSVITMTSLGYGDYRPIGISRFFTIIQAIIGVGMLGVLIAKLLSVRQNNMLSYLLLAQQRETLKNFKDNLGNAGKQLKKAYERRDVDEILVAVKNYYNHLFSLSRFLGVTIEYKLLDTDSSNFVFKGLVRSIGQSLSPSGVAIENIGRINPSLKNHTKKLIITLEIVVEKLENYNNNIDCSNLKNILDKFKQTIDVDILIDEIFIENKTGKSIKELKNDSEFIKEVVKNLPDTQPYPLNIHRTIAKKLNAPAKAIYVIIRNLN